MVKPNAKINLNKVDTAYTANLKSKDEAKKLLKKNIKEWQYICIKYCFKHTFTAYYSAFASKSTLLLLLLKKNMAELAFLLDACIKHQSNTICM